MTNGHDHPAPGPGGDFQFRRYGLRQDGQRMVARRDEGVRKALEHTDIGMEHRARLAMQQFRRAVNGGAERHSDGLMAEADTE